MNKKAFAVVVATLATIGFTSVARATTDDVTFDFDSSAPSSAVTAPTSITFDSLTIDVTTNQMVEISGGVGYGDLGTWSIIPQSPTNLMKIWDNANLELSESAVGWSISCTTGNTAPVVVVTITSYFEGAVVETMTQTLGLLNEWETLTSTSDSEVDRIDIVGRDASNTSSNAAFGCDDLTLSFAAEPTTTAPPTTQAPTEDTLVKTGADGSRGTQIAVLLMALGATTLVITRRRGRA